MKIELNGETADAFDARNVAELVSKLGLPEGAVLIEHNGTALHRREWPQRPMAEGDRVEVIRVVAGG